MTEIYPSPRWLFPWCQLLYWRQKSLGSISLRMACPEKRLFCGEGTWGTDLILFRQSVVINFSSILLVYRLGRVLAVGEALGLLCPVFSITTIQVEWLVLHLSSLETLLSLLGAMISKLFPLNILIAIFKRFLDQFEDHYLLSIYEANKLCLFLVISWKTYIGG